MNQFIQRVANYIANVSPCLYFHWTPVYHCIQLLLTPPSSYFAPQEVFIKCLAESKTFQRVAVHTDWHIQKYKKEGMERINSQIDELHKQATKAAYSTSENSAASLSSSSAGEGLL